MKRYLLPQGIVSVVQTPFLKDGVVDFVSLELLINDAISSDVDGLLAPAVASEVAYLDDEERRDLIERTAGFIDGRVPFIVGASSEHPEVSTLFGYFAEAISATAYLVAVPNALYSQPDKEIIAYFQSIASMSKIPLLIQDLQWSGFGLSIDCMDALWQQIPTLAGFKIETVPAGPKYTQVRNRLGEDVYLCGGWAVPQLIEAFDRGVNAMIPESSMIRIYKAIHLFYQSGQRENALKLFNHLLPILSFTNQEITTSIAFFKRLLVRKGIFQNEMLRWTGFEWDGYNSPIGDDLIERCLMLERELNSDWAKPT